MRKLGDHNWTEAEANELKRLSRIGISKVEAARRLGRLPSTIAAHARLAGLTWKPPPPKPKKAKPPSRNPAPRPWTEEDDQRLTQLAAKGVPIGLAANRMDRPYNAVLRHSKLLGLTWQRDASARARLRDPSWTP